MYKLQMIIYMPAYYLQKHEYKSIQPTYRFAIHCRDYSLVYNCSVRITCKYLITFYNLSNVPIEQSQSSVLMTQFDYILL